MENSKLIKLLSEVNELLETNPSIETINKTIDKLDEIILELDDESEKEWLYV